METTALLLPALILAIVVVLIVLVHKRSVRSQRLIEKYLRLHARCPGPADEVDEWLLEKVDAIWFDGRERSRLKPAMKLGNIHQLWYKGASWDAMECEQFLMDTEQKFDIRLAEGSITRDLTLKALADLIRSRLSSHSATH